MERMVWPDGPVCPHCKSDKPYRIMARGGSASGARQGLLKCRGCKKQFTVTVGTIFEKTHVPLSKWVMAVFILSSSKKGISAHQMHRMLGVTYKTAWFMFHRLRHAASVGPLAELLNGTVEVDEAFIGGAPKKDAEGKVTKKGYRRNSSKIPVVALIQRDGESRAGVIPSVSARNLRTFMQANIDEFATVNTDTGRHFIGTKYHFGNHQQINHSAGEFSRINPDGSKVSVNYCESFFSLLKRGIFGSFHHVSPEHLQRYCDEFVFRWNHRKVNDGQRMAALMQSAIGKRLTYRATVNH